MSAGVIRIVIGIVLLAHGIGHVLGALPAFGVSLTAQHGIKSWLVTKALGEGVSRVLAVLLFGLALLAFLAAGLALLDIVFPLATWSRYAVAAALLSMLALLVFPRGFPTLFPNVIGALALDAAVLITVWWAHWPAALLGL